MGNSKGIVKRLRIETIGAAKIVKYCDEFYKRKSEIMRKWIYYNGIKTDYKVDEAGNVYSYKNGKPKLLKLINSSFGYYVVNIYINGKVKQMRVNRLIAEAFIPNPENKPEVNHKDGNKHNNHVSNLEWNTSKENTNHALDTGLRVRNGDDFHSSILCEKDIHKICKLLVKNKLKAKDIPSKIGSHCTLKMIHNILYNNTWSYITCKYDLSKHTIDEPHGPSKMDVKTVKKICKMLEKGKSLESIAKKCKCTVGMVRHIKNRDSWTSVSNNYNIDLWKIRHKKDK